MTDTDIPKEYDRQKAESRWRGKWGDAMYYFDWESGSPQYIIDTPPPYPTGDFHIGNAFNWCYIDFIARYKRMRGYNVMFPQGWDCHGLPTEVKVEETHGITKNEVSRTKFRELCEELTSKNIESMRKTLMDLGFSIDWSNEYVTMKPDYYVRTQHSFVKMYNKGMIYQTEHPVNWCPRCGTAIAFAEVEYDQRETVISTIPFDDMRIATTRPELLPACVGVAVHPDDERYRNKVGTEVTVPVFGYKVPVFTDPEVDPEFGTGAVMICTFGDKQDVRWWKEHDLPLRKAIDVHGRMTEIAGKYEGMGIEECKKAILEDMKKAGLIFAQEKLEQNVGLCWRCDTPIEILSERQWFVRVDKERIIEAAQEINWYPKHMYIRLKNWTESMEWDWCISRQRIFATPIPAWCCDKCGKVMVAKEEWLPVDPTVDSPHEHCECGSAEFTPEYDVLDTWMDSSISTLSVGGWLTDHFRYPTQLRPQGHDIIRTWAFYTILRSLALVDMKPWDDILINGMVLGEDGYKMSKSRENTISPDEVLSKECADAFRQWAAIGGSPGSDVQFTWKDITAASRFLQKLWSIFRFSAPHIIGFDCEKTPELMPLDRWILFELNQVIKTVTKELDKYNFDTALKEIRGFAWRTFADNYIELVKSRLYGEDGSGKVSARFTLKTVIVALMKLLAPFIPFFTEEVHSRIMPDSGSIHVQSWPVQDDSLCSASDRMHGERIKDITSEIRRYKSDNGIALNAPLGRVEIYAEDLDVTDIAGAVNADVSLIAGRPEFEVKTIAIKPKMGVIGPKFKGQAKKIVDVLGAVDAQEAASKLESSGYIALDIDGESVKLGNDSVDRQTTVTSAGRDVDVLNVDNIIVVIMK